jgi:hypothetical protein
MPPAPSDLLRDADARIRAGDHAGAITLYKKFISQHRAHPKASAARTRAAQLSIMLGEHDAAAELIERAGAPARSDPLMMYTLAQAHIGARRLGPAREALEHALAIDPDHAAAIARMAVVLQHQRRWEEALALIESADARGLGSWDLDHAFAELAPRAGRVPQAIDRVRARLTETNLRPEARIELEFVQAQLLEKQGEHAAAWEAVTRANALRRRPFDADAYEAAIGKVKAAWSPGTLAALAPDADKPEPRPELVFVVGLPRSGTTLVEQILAAHPDAEGSGEPAFIDLIAPGVGLSPDADPASIARVRPDRRARAGRDLLARERKAAGGADGVVIDKQPENDRQLGFLAAAAPGAKVILMRRDPRDVAVSCLFRHFTGGHAWAADPDALARVIAARLDLHAHWLKVMPEHAPWLHLTVADYERVVAEPEAEARRLVGFAGLAWDDACLKFADRPRMVPTLEPMQAGQGVYTGSVARWKRYEPFAGTWMQRLGETAARHGFEA